MFASRFDANLDSPASAAVEVMTGLMDAFIRIATYCSLHFGIASSQWRLLKWRPPVTHPQRSSNVEEPNPTARHVATTAYQVKQEDLSTVDRAEFSHQNHREQSLLLKRPPSCSYSVITVPAQWIASLCAIISAGVLLCCYKKGTYTCTPVFYVLATLFDVVAAMVW